MDGISKLIEDLAPDHQGMLWLAVLCLQPQMEAVNKYNMPSLWYKAVSYCTVPDVSASPFERRPPLVGAVELDEIRLVGRALSRTLDDIDSAGMHAQYLLGVALRAATQSPLTLTTLASRVTAAIEATALSSKMRGVWKTREFYQRASGAIAFDLARFRRLDDIEEFLRQQIEPQENPSGAATHPLTDWVLERFPNPVRHGSLSEAVQRASLWRLGWKNPEHRLIAERLVELPAWAQPTIKEAK